MKSLRINISQRLNAISFFLAIINLYILVSSYFNDRLIHGIGYVLFFYVSIFILELLTQEKNLDEPKKPRTELIIAIVFSLLGITAISLNFYLKSNFDQMGFLIKLPLLIIMLLFTTPLGVALYYLKNKNRLVTLGFRLKPFKILLVGILIWLITGLFAVIFNYEGILWTKAFEEFGGILGLIVQGVIGAALIEELWRYIFITRIGWLTKNIPLAILCASIIWSIMHIPVTIYKGGTFISTFDYCLRIITLGYIWGLLSYKTKSIFPSVLAHGFNLWGFQNM